METIPCPGCRTELGPEITACPICTRPRSKYEITRAYATLRAMKERRRRRPFIIAAWVLGLGSVGWAVREYRVPLAEAYAAARTRAARFVDQARDPARVAAHSPLIPSAPQFTPPAAPTVNSYRPPGLLTAPAAPSPAAAPIPAAPPPPATLSEAPRRRPRGDLQILNPLEPSQWVLRGTVYDIETLRPAPAVALSVRYGDRSAVDVTTDEDGRYLAVLNRVPDGGYDVLNHSYGYVHGVFSESDIPYAQLDKDERAGMADSARAGDVHPTPISDIIGEDAIHRDLFVVRRR